MTPQPLDLDFVRPRCSLRRPLMLLALLIVAFVVCVLRYVDAAQTISLQRAEKKSREVVETAVAEAPRRSAEEARALKQEVAAVNRQIRQLNQAWEVLFADLRAVPGSHVRLLGVDVDARTGSVRVMGIAPDAAEMADYAAYLADKKAFRAVVLSRHEMDASRLRFVVDAKWAE